MNTAASQRPDGPAHLRQEVEALHGAAWGWALTCCRRDVDEAAEVLQDSYAKVLNGKADFGHRASFKTWLFAVIRRTALEHGRRHALRRLGLSRYMGSGLGPRRPTPVDPVEVQERADALGRALGALARRQREVLHLVFYDDLTLAESALAMGVSVGAARRHYHRGKKNLLARLELQGVSHDR